MREKTKNRPNAAARSAGKTTEREASRADSRPKTPSRFRLPVVSGAEGRTRRFVRDTRSELKKVVWPTRDEAINLTMIVIAVSVAVGIFLGTVDYFFKILFEFLVAGF